MGVYLTQKDLHKRGFDLCSRCYLCQEYWEAVDHLFFV